MFAPPQLSWQFYRAIADTHEAADLVAERFPHAPDFTVSPFFERHRKPTIGAVTTGRHDGVECCHAVVQHDALLQFHQFRACGIAMHADRIATHHLRRGVHQGIGQLAIGGKQQQTGRRQIQSSDCYPASALKLR